MQCILSVLLLLLLSLTSEVSPSSTQRDIMDNLVAVWTRLRCVCYNIR